MKRLWLLGACSLYLACGEATSSDEDQAPLAQALDAGLTPSDPSARQGGPADAGASDGGLACAAMSPQQARVACAANAMLATLTPEQRNIVSLPLTDYVSRTRWNNLPVAMRLRAGAQLGDLSQRSQDAVLDLMNLALNERGQSTMTGILRSDDFLKLRRAGYGSELYAIAIFGTPSATADFEVMFGGHHMAFNLNFVDGGFYPVPQHLGSEPKSPFTIDGGTYAPMAPKGDAIFAVYDELDASQRSAAYLSGQTFSDVVVNPGLDYGRGQERASKTAYPTGANRRGVIVSSLTAAQQALVTAAIEQWARQYPAEVADQLMADYTGGYADTYFAWGGSASGPDKDVSGSYFRIDGPRVWIELVVQNGIEIRNETHYHSIYHDKTRDYGGEF